MTVRAAALFRKRLPAGRVLFIFINIIDNNDPAAQAQGSLHGVSQPLAYPLFDHQTVHYDFNSMFFLPCKADILRQLMELPVNNGTGIAV